MQDPDGTPDQDEPESRWWKVLRHVTIFLCVGWLVFPIYAVWLWEWWKRKHPPANPAKQLRWDKPPGGGTMALFVIVATLAVGGSAIADQSRFERDVTSFGMERVMPDIPAVADHVQGLEGLALHAPARGVFALCDGMFLDWSYGSKEEAEKIGLTGRDIQNAAESRLRTARLYKERSHQAMVISIDLTDQAFRLDIALERAVGDLGYGIDGVATIWTTGFLGHPSSRNHILDALSQALDSFLATYLRLNAPVCEHTRD